MNSTVFIRIFNVHYSDKPVFQTLSLNLKVCGKCTIESVQECESPHADLLHLHIIVRFNRQEDAIDAINRYNNGRFMNRYVMRVDFYRPSKKAEQKPVFNHERSQEIDYQQSFSITNTDRKYTNSNTRVEKVDERKRSPSFKRSPPRQRKRRTSSSSTSSSSSASSSNSSSSNSCKDIRSRLSTIPRRASILPRRSEHTSRSRSRYTYKEKVKQAIKRRVRIASSGSSSDTSFTKATSETDSSPPLAIENRIRKDHITPKSATIDKSINDAIKSIRIDDAALISDKQTKKESKKVKFSPIKFGHVSVTSQTTKGKEGITRKLVVPKPRTGYQRVVSLTQSQTKTDNLPENILLVKLCSQELNPKCSLSEKANPSDMNITSIDKAVSVDHGHKHTYPGNLDTKESNVGSNGSKKDYVSVIPRATPAREEKTSLPETVMDITKQSRKIQFNIKNTFTLVKGETIFTESDDQHNSNVIHEDMSKRKRNKSELCVSSFKSKIPSVPANRICNIKQKQKLYKSKSFHSYEDAGLLANNQTIQHDHQKKTVQTHFQSKCIQKKLTNDQTREQQMDSALPPKADCPDVPQQLQRVGVECVPSPGPNTLTSICKEPSVSSDNRTRWGVVKDSESHISADNASQSYTSSNDTEHKPSKGNSDDQQVLGKPINKTHLQQINPEISSLENKTTLTAHKVEYNSIPVDSKACDVDQSFVSDNLSTMSVSFCEDISCAETGTGTTALLVDNLKHSDTHNDSMRVSEPRLHLKDNIQSYNNNITSCVKFHGSSTSRTDKVNPAKECSILKPSESLCDESVQKDSAYGLFNKSENAEVSDATQNNLKDNLDSSDNNSSVLPLNQSTSQAIAQNLPQKTTCNKSNDSIHPITTLPDSDTLKDSTGLNSHHESNTNTTNTCSVDPPVVTSCSNPNVSDTCLPNIETTESSVVSLHQDSPSSVTKFSTESIDPVKKLKRPMSEDRDDSQKKIKSSINPAKRHKQDDGSVSSLVKPHQMSYLLGEKEKLEKLYNEECRTVCNVVQMLISQDPSLEQHIESSLSQTLENIGEKYVIKLQDTVLELSELES